MADDDAAESSTNHPSGSSSAALKDDGREDRRQSGPRRSKEDKKAQRGANKARRWNKVRDDSELCWRIASGGTCEFGEESVLMCSSTLIDSDSDIRRCRFSHDIPAYLSSKPHDIRFILPSELIDLPPYINISPPSLPPAEETKSSVHSSIDFTTTCPIFESTGECRHGLKCRFLGGHVQLQPNATEVNENSENTETNSTGGLALLVDPEKQARAAISEKEVNFAGGEVLKLLRSKKVCVFGFSFNYHVYDELN